MEKLNVSILSFPSSGKHWILYILDKIFLLGLKSMKPDRWETISMSNKMVISHSHLCWGTNIEPLKNTSGNIFLLRNYKENVTKFAEKSDLNNLESFKEYLDFGAPLNNRIQNQSYMRALFVFDKMDKPKILVYYEDLMENPKKELIRLSEWFNKNFSFGCDPENIDKFISDIDSHINEGRKFHIANVRNLNDLQSNGNIHFHSNKLSDDMKKTIDEYVKTNYSELFEKYLKRYEE